ncbi:MAG: glycosyltransferase family 2 protein [Chloroflexota bacterium]
MATNPSEPRRRLIFATVLYWRARELALLERCVESLLAQSLDAPFELRVLVIDNGCSLVPRLPDDSRVEVIRSTYNRGFSGGHNFGIRRALSNNAEWVLLFNSDAIAEAGCIAELLTTGEAEPSAAFIGPLVLRATSEDRIESAGQSFDTATGRHREIARGQPAASVGTSPRRVDAISGCALFARTSVLESIGLLDEALFIYFEDLEWCLRARRAGYTVVMTPTGRVRHVGGGSTGSASLMSTYLSTRNHIVIAGRYGGKLPKALALGYQLAYLVRWPERRSKHHFAAVALAAIDAWAGRLGAGRYGAHRD